MAFFPVAPGQTSCPALHGGGPVDREVLRFWEAYGNFKLALVFIVQARAFLDGVPSVELASLGRRIAEAEDELLTLMEPAA